MKRILLFLPIIFLFSCSKPISTEAIEKDCEYLETILPEVAIEVSLAVDEGLDIQDFINEIKSDYIKYATLCRNEKIENADENGIYNMAFSSAILTAWEKIFITKNSHVEIKGRDCYYAPYCVNRVHTSEIRFQKNEEFFYVADSSDDQIVKGMLYTGDPNNLVKVYSNGSIIYQYVVYSTADIENAEINLNNQNYTIKVKRNELKSKSNKDIDFSENDNVLNIIIRTFSPHFEKNKDEYEQTTNAICKRINNFDKVVFDFRDNNGGYVSNFIPILLTMLSGDVYEENDELFEKFDQALQYGEKELLTETIKNNYLLQGQNISSFYYHNQGQRYIVKEEYNEFLDVTNPVFKGSIYIISNTHTYSAAELIIAFLKYYFKNNLIHLGEKTGGMLDFGGTGVYLLPDSKIRLQLCDTDCRENYFLSHLKDWRGDTEGFYPDYWFFTENENEIEEFILLNEFK